MKALKDDGWKPLPLSTVKDFWKGIDKANLQGLRSVDDAFLRGLKEGARRERRALRRWANVYLGGNVSRKVIVDQYLSLAARSKAKPPLEGK